MPKATKSTGMQDPGMPKLKTSPGMQEAGMSDAGMQPSMPNPGMSGMPDRGRPAFTDKSKLKTSTMTICLTPDVHNQLRELAVNQNQKPAAMGRILIETGIKEQV